MNINYISANNISLATRAYANQYQPVIGNKSPNNPVYMRDSVILGNLPSPYNTYSATPATLNTPNWSINDYYLLAPEEVSPRLQELVNEIESADLSGMTNVEKYDWIENKFVEAFGEDFRMAHALALWGSGYTSILPVFDNQVRLQVGGWEAAKRVNFERLYSGMNTNEVRNMIREKYPQNLTNRDFLLMFNEMDNVGVADQGVYVMRYQYVQNLVIEYKTEYADGKYPYWNMETTNKWAGMLDNPVSMPVLLEQFNSPRVRANIDIFSAKDFLLSCFTAYADSDRQFGFDLNVMLFGDRRF